MKQTILENVQETNFKFMKDLETEHEDLDTTPTKLSELN